MTKHVSLRDGLGGKLIPLASFRFEKGCVVAVYHDPGYGRDIEQDGIGAMVGSAFKILRPSDGKPFYDALDAVYSQSTLMVVSAGPPYADKTLEELEARFLALDRALATLVADSYPLYDFEVREHAELRAEIERRRRGR